MKFLVAIALLAFVAAEANRLPGLTLPRPHFKEGLTYKYEALFNITSGVLGLSSQVSTSVLLADVKIRVLSGNEHVLKIENVRSSKSVAAVDRKHGDIELHREPELEERLSSPIKFTLYNGTVTSYSLSSKDDVESKKLKKSILRSLEMEIPEDALVESYDQAYVSTPIMYNTTKNSNYGVHISNYIITSSPDVEYPLDTRVYNISRIDNCEGEWYPAYKQHHNFHSQGCPEVCRPCKEWKDNYYAAGCPSGFEPHHSPIKRSFSHDHALSMYEEVLTPEIITTVETHFAKMYDQDMEVLIRYQMKRVEVTSDEITLEEDGQEMYEDLHKYEVEIDDQIEKQCKYETSDNLVETAVRLIDETAALIYRNETNSPIGEKIILLQDVLSRFTYQNFRELVKNPKNSRFPLNHDVKQRSDEERIQRQVWMQMLPLIGTADSVKFLVEYIERALETEGLREMTVWEAKEMLESLPQNIERPDKDTLTEMKKLMTGKVPKQSILLHSAVYLSIGRIIGQICGNAPLIRVEETEKRSWLKSFQRATPENIGLPVCPTDTVNEILEFISNKLKRTTEPAEIAIYIETLTHFGMWEVLDVVAPYAHGPVENMAELTPRHVSFLRTVVLKSLHNIVRRHPAEVMEIVLPIYFNETESPKIRNAAFGVLIRCQPSLAVLERIVSHSWFEKSKEVGSYVTSTLQTFGNSSMPCMQLLSNRIREVLPQMKKFNVGIHHAKNHMWTYFDAVRQFGLEGRFEYTPNNESIVPSTFYHSLTYTMDSLKEVVFQNSLNIEGLTHEMIVKRLRDYISLPDVEKIPGDVFGLDKNGDSPVTDHMIDDLRYVSSQKFFYKNSFYYLDKKSRDTLKKDMYEFFYTYLWQSEREVTGYVVKVYLPSSYHTIAMAKTLPYPVEFQMRQPVVFSLAVKSHESTTTLPKLKDFHLHLRPSFYFSKLFTHQIKNLRDCKEIGVFYAHKIGMDYPFEIKYNALRLRDTVLEFKYRIPKMQGKNVLYYYTDAGTYAGKKTLEDLPLNEERKTILTRPTPFKFETQVDFVGMPPLNIAVHTENLNLFQHKMPRSPVEALDLAVRRILNAGWRYKSANITVSEDSPQWANEMEATFRIEYSRNHTIIEKSDETPNSEWNRGSRSSMWEQNSDDYGDSQRQTEDASWKGYPYRSAEDPEDYDWAQSIIPRKGSNLKDFSKNANIMIEKLEKRSRMFHRLKISLAANQLVSNSYVLFEYDHTYDQKIHRLFAELYSNETDDRKEFKISANHVMTFMNLPDEFDYSSKFGKQSVVFVTALNWEGAEDDTCPFENAETGASGSFRYKSLKEVLEKQLVSHVDDEHFLPERVEECRRDVTRGYPLSVDCVKTLREHSAYNYLGMYIAWNSNFPKNERAMWLAKTLDMYVKHYTFEHVNITPEKINTKNIEMEMTYIDKFVDEPVIDWQIRKDYETVYINRFPVKTIQPLSSIYPLHEAFLLKKTNNSYPARCVMSTLEEQNYVQTYDLVQYQFTPRDCFYVLSTHCTQTKLFAVLLKNSQEIHIKIARMTLILKPQADDSIGYRVTFNERDVLVKDAYVFDKKENFYAYTVQYGKHRHLQVIAGNAGLSVHYDGKTVKIQVSPTYKGELCGLCSEFDGEDIREFRGIDRCLYRDPKWFADSNIVHRSKECTPVDTTEKICDMIPTTENYSPKSRNEPTVMRNKVIYRGDEVCFSVRPIPSCQGRKAPRDIQKARTGFHCLPKDDLTAKKLVEESERRILDEVRRKSVDHVQEVDVAKRC